MTLKVFDGWTYTPYGILSNLQVELGGKTIEIDVEVIDGSLNYNILLGKPWIYAMATVLSTYSRNIAFPFQGGITIIDQQTFLPNSSQVTGSIPMIHGSYQLLQNIGVGLLKDPTLMGTFPYRLQTTWRKWPECEPAIWYLLFRRCLNTMLAWIITRYCLQAQ